MCIYGRKIYLDSGLEITNILTQASLTMGIYRHRFYRKEFDIPILKGAVAEFIREGYHGGRVEKYKRFMLYGYYFDVRSLYPYSMLRDMPVGDPAYMKGIELETFFGFIRAKVYCPTTLKRPFLGQKKFGRLIYPYGEFTGVFFSEELKMAVKFGYTIELIEGYRFERGVDIFAGYINYLATQKNKCEAEGDTVGRTIYKLLANSLYGRFGMGNHDIKSEIVSIEQFRKIASAHEIISFSEFNGPLAGLNYAIVVYRTSPSPELCGKDVFYDQMVQGDRSVHDTYVSVGISAAVTAYARIHMYQFI